jgi:hypothetical protein
VRVSAILLAKSENAAEKALICRWFLAQMVAKTNILWG